MALSIALRWLYIGRHLPRGRFLSVVNLYENPYTGQEVKKTVWYGDMEEERRPWWHQSSARIKV